MNIFFGTWNVLALSRPGRMPELAEQITYAQLETDSIQATRLSVNGLIKRNNYSLYYSGSNKTGQVCTGFIVLKKGLKYASGFEPYNECTCNSRIRGKYNNIPLINVYAPTEDKIDEDEENFEEDLQPVVYIVPKK